jgi:glutamate/aspartate transport system substrate-binding protein
MLSLSKKLAASCVAIVALSQAAQPEELGPTLKKIKGAGTMAIGYREALVPLSYAGAEGQPAGLALDLCALIGSKVKETLGLAALNIAYQPVAAAQSADLVQNDTIALDCGPTPITADLQKLAAFSNPIFVSELTWLVPRRLRVEREGRRRRRTETISPSSPEDLKEKTVALTHGSAATSIALTLSNDRTLGLSIVEGKDNVESFKLLETGKASAFLADTVQLAALKAGAKNPDAFGFLNGGYPGTSYALMLRKDDKAFKDLVDGVLAEAVKSGEYAKLYKKWFENPIPPKNVNLDYPMTEKLKETLEAAANKQTGQ